MKNILSIMVCVLLAACAQSSSVINMGPETYFVSATAAPVRGGSAAARPIALAEANAHCARLKKQILVKNIENADVTFRCLEPGDPELKRPEYKKSPDIVIEDSRK